MLVVAVVAGLGRGKRGSLIVRSAWKVEVVQSEIYQLRGSRRLIDVGYWMPVLRPKK